MSFVGISSSDVLAEGLCAKGELDGVPFSLGTRQELYLCFCSWLRAASGPTRLITYVNPHVYNLARHNEKVRIVLRNADMVAVDGLGFALGVRWLIGHAQTRTVMTPLFDKILGTESLPHLRALLIGGNAGVAESGATAMNRASPRIHVVATSHGYAEEAKYLKFLGAHPEADLVLVAMGSPRSEEFMATVRDIFPGKVFWNIGGGTLHFYAGTLKRVPHWVSSAGLQWLWRILHEPTIAPRYLVGIPRFLISLIRSRVLQTTQSKQTYGRAYR